MNSHDERGVVPVDAQGNTTAASVRNSSSSTIKIDSLCIKLGFVKEKGDAEKCKHFSIRGYASGMRERGRSSFLPLAGELPPMDVPNFRYWLCQSCLQNCGNANTSHKTPVDSMCDDRSMIRPCARSIPFPPQDCGRVAVLPFGEGTSGLKPVHNTSDDDDDADNDERLLSALVVHKKQPSQEIPASNAVSQEPVTFRCNDTNFASEANAGILSMKERNDGRDDEDPQQDSVVKETIAGVVGPSIQSNDHPNGHTRRKTRKVRLLKELLCGNNEIQQREKKNSAIGFDPKPSSSLPNSSLVKRKVPHDQDQRSVDIATPVNACKKSKALKGNAAAKATMVEHSKDPGVIEGAQNDKKYSWNKHGTHRSSIVGKVSSDPVTAWRSIFSDVAKTDNRAAATYDISKDRGTSGPRSNIMAPPHPEKKFNFSKKMPKIPLKSKLFGEDSRSAAANVRFGSTLQDRQSETELGLDLSLNYDPQSQLRAMSSTFNRPHIQDYSRKGDFFMGESSIPHRIPPDSKSKEGSMHDVSNRHATRPVLYQEQRSPYTQFSYGSCSEHQKLDFSDPNKWNTGVRGYSDVMRPHNHQRQGKMVSMGRSDEREIVELLAKNQYERNLCEARGGNSSFMPHTSGFHHNINMHERMSMTSSHQDYFHMIRPTSMSEKSNMRNPASGSGFFHQDQVSEFNVFDGFQQSRNQPSSGIWMSDSGAQRYHNSHYNHVPKANKKMTNTHIYTPSNMQVLEAFNKYNNGRHHQNETDAFSNYPTSIPPHGYTKFSDKDNQKRFMDLDLNVVAPNAIEEQNNFESLNMTSSSKEYHPKNIHSLDSSYRNEAIPAMQLLSLMDAGKSTHPVNTNERKYSKPLSPCYTHCSPNMTGKAKSTASFQFPNSRFFQSSSSSGVGASFPCEFQAGQKLTSGQTVKLTSGQVYYKPQEEKSTVCRPEDSYVFPVPWKVNEERVTVGPTVDPIETGICTINKNPADFSTPGPENMYMIDVEDLVFRGEKGRSAAENANGPKRQKRS